MAIVSAAVMWRFKFVMRMMKKITFRRKPAYTQEQISEQLGQIAELMKLRDTNVSKEERERLQAAVDVSQEILVYMLEEVKRGNERRR